MKARLTKEQRSEKAERLTDDPCPRCLKLAQEGKIRMETVQRLPPGAYAPLSREDGKLCCRDCAAAEGLLRLERSIPGFISARIAVGNCRQEQYRLPGVPMGLVQRGLVQASKPGDLEDQHKWLESRDWFGEDEDMPEGK